METKDGFKKYVEQEKIVEKEVMVKNLLIEIQSYLPKKMDLFDSYEINDVCLLFLHSSDGVDWLRGFLLSVKEEMRSVLPPGAELIILTDKTKYIEARKSHFIDENQEKHIIEIAYGVRRKFEEKFSNLTEGKYKKPA